MNGLCQNYPSAIAHEGRRNGSEKLFIRTLQRRGRTHLPFSQTFSIRTDLQHQRLTTNIITPMRQVYLKLSLIVFHQFQCQQTNCYDKLLNSSMWIIIFKMAQKGRYFFYVGS